MSFEGAVSRGAVAGVCFALAVFADAYAAQVPLRFEDIPGIILERNLHVQGAKRLEDASEARTGHFTRSFLPRVELQGGYEVFQTGPYDTMKEPFGAIEARLNLFRGGRDLLEDRARRAEANQAKAEYQQAFADELLEARRIYWQVVYQKEQIVFLTSALDQNEKNIAAANKRIRAGLATETDRLEFEMNRVQLEQDLARLTLGASNSQRSLSVLLAMPEDSEFETPAETPHQHDDELLRVSLDTQTHREVVASTASRDVAGARKSQSFRWWVPSIDLFGNYSLYTFREREYLARQDRFETVAGIRLTLELFDGLESYSEARSLGLQAEAHDKKAVQTAMELRTRFETAKQELKLTHDLIHSAEKGVDQGSQYLSRTLSEYARGVKNSPDVLGATEKLIDLKRRLAELRKDYHTARAELLATLGR